MVDAPSSSLPDPDLVISWLISTILCALRRILLRIHVACASTVRGLACAHVVRVPGQTPIIVTDPVHIPCVISTTDLQQWKDLRC